LETRKSWLNSGPAKASVCRLCRRMGFIPVDMGVLSASLDVENMPLHLFPSWRLPVLLSLALFALFYLYNFIRDVLHPYLTAGKSAFYKMPIELVNVTLPCAALVLLTLVYVPGLCAAFLQLRWGTKYRRFPSCLDKWLTQRKQLGLCGFLCAVLHMIYSLCLPMRKSARYKLMTAAFKQVCKAGAVRLGGIMAIGLLSLLAVTSLPSVASTVNWREFSFIQVTLWTTTGYFTADVSL
uniref:STEAP3 metalloreductase n=1 Tax=Neogobius melanostomus TaxID=47308 RepID=A0A8C6SCC5_9GOBI